MFGWLDVYSGYGDFIKKVASKDLSWLFNKQEARLKMSGYKGQEYMDEDQQIEAFIARPELHGSLMKLNWFGKKALRSFELYSDGVLKYYR